MKKRNFQPDADSLICELFETVKSLSRIRRDLERSGLSKMHNYSAAETLLGFALDDLEVEHDEQKERRERMM